MLTKSWDQVSQRTLYEKKVQNNEFVIFQLGFSKLPI